MIKPSRIQQNGVAPSIELYKASPFLDLRGGAVTDSATVSTVKPFLHDFLAGSDALAHIIFAVILATLLKPSAKFYYEQMPLVFQSFDGKGGRAKTIEKDHLRFDKTRFSHIVQTVAEAARLLIAVALFDVLKAVILSFGVKIPKSDNLTDVFGYGLYLLWGARRLSTLKLYMLKKIMVNTDIINDPRRVHVIHRLSDYALLFFGIFIFYEILNVEMGYSAKSLLGLLSLFTAAIALATKDIITNFLNGVILSASDRIYVGDFISINGDVKKVHRLGWLETALRDSDDILHTIPNTELVSTNLSNLSRVQTCQVRQTLKFPHSAMGKLSKLSQDIKNEIRLACPSIITDGTRPFRCYWIDFKSDRLEVFVNAHFRIPPVGDEYYENRQNCLLAIDRAIRKNEIEHYSGA